MSANVQETVHDEEADSTPNDVRVSQSYPDNISKHKTLRPQSLAFVLAAKEMCLLITVSPLPKVVSLNPDTDTKKLMNTSRDGG